MWFVKPINVIDCTGLVHSITPLPRTLTLGSLGAMMISVVSFNEYSQAHESFAI
jgi:RecG-like helicase